MKNKWTKETAMAWVEKVESGMEKRGLKYCSALSFLKRAPSSETKTNFEEENV